MRGDEAARWPVVSSRDLHRDDWVIALREDRIRLPQELDSSGDPGETFRRLVLETPGAAMVLAIDEEDRVVLLRQYRHPAGERLVELPAGLLDQPGEEPEVAARRELREEAELEADHWERLISVYPSPGISDELQHVFRATGLRPASRGGFVLEHEEREMSVERVSFAELLEAVLAGSVRDSPLVVAVLAEAARRQRASSSTWS